MVETAVTILTAGDQPPATDPLPRPPTDSGKPGANSAYSGLSVLAAASRIRLKVDFRSANHVFPSHLF